MKPFEALKNLYLEENRRRFPSLPENARYAPKYTDRTSNGLTRCIIDFLRLNGCQVERIACTGRMIDQSRIVEDCLGNRRKIGSTQWIPSSMQPGTADISSTIAGRSVKIEVKCKTTNDKQRPAQREYQRQVEAAGGVYLLISSFEQFYNWFNQFQHGSN